MRYFLTVVFMLVLSGQITNASIILVTDRTSRINFIDQTGCTNAFTVITNDIDAAFRETVAGTCSGTTDTGQPYSGTYQTSHYSEKTDKSEILVDMETLYFVSLIDSTNQASSLIPPRFRIFSNSSYRFNVDEAGAGQIEFSEIASTGASSPFVVLLANDVTVYNSNTDPDLFRYEFFPGVNYHWVVDGDFDANLSDFLQAAEISARLKIESDGDMLADFEDNCIDVANTFQQDTNGDGFGNMCDPDLNNDCIVNFQDAAILNSLFLTDDDDADFNSDGIVNFIDLSMFSDFFLNPPGPSGVPNDCD